jgi:hypothetical protein
MTKLNGPNLQNPDPNSANQFYIRQVTQWQQYNANPDPMFGTVSASGPTSEGTHCIFGMDSNGNAPASGQWYRDGVWIKQYNAASNGNFIAWILGTQGVSAPRWQVNNTNAQGFDYVGRVCSQ